MMAFSDLTKRQREVFEQIATGHDKGHPEQTLWSLAKRGYITRYPETLPGDPPVTIMRCEVPIPVHIEWCQWCEKRLKKRGGQN